MAVNRDSLLLITLWTMLLASLLQAWAAFDLGVTLPACLAMGGGLGGAAVAMVTLEVTTTITVRWALRFRWADRFLGRTFQTCHHFLRLSQQTL